VASGGGINAWGPDLDYNCDDGDCRRALYLSYDLESQKRSAKSSAKSGTTLANKRFVFANMD
jgi:hypothetical protein